MMGNSTKKHKWIVVMTFVLTALSQKIQAQSGSFGSTFVGTGGEMAIFGQHNFITGSGTINAGIVGSERQPVIGVYSFVDPNGSWINASSTAFMDAYVRTYKAGAFTFPIGDNNVYRPAAVSASSNTAPTTAAYFGVDPTTATTSNLAGAMVFCRLAGHFQLLRKQPMLAPLITWNIGTLTEQAQPRLRLHGMPILRLPQWWGQV